MLAQQGVAFAKARAQVGNMIEVLVDRPASTDEGGSFIARSPGQAPEIDSVVHVKNKSLHAGQLVNVKVIDYQAYDLVALVPKTRAKSLAVLGAH